MVKAWVIILIVVIIIAVVATILFFVFRRREEPIPPPPPGKQCEKDEDCEPEQRCSESGYCVSKGGCFRDEDCPQGQRCVAGKCVPIQCSKNTDCLQTQECRDRICVTKRCTSVSDCGTNQVCHRGECTQPSCTKNVGCTSSGDICINGKCTFVGEFCETNDDCHKPLICSESQGAKRCVECSDENPCPNGQYCNSFGLCTFPCSKSPVTRCLTGQVCAGDHCCPTGDRCGLPCSPGEGCFGKCPHCVSGVCSCQQGENTYTCVSNEDCKSGTCLDTIRRICVPTNYKCFISWIPPENRLPPYENYPGDCFEDTPWCNGGACSTTSLGARCELRGCPAGEFCVNNICIREAGKLGDFCYRDKDCEVDLFCRDLLGSGTGRCLL